MMNLLDLKLGSLKSFGPAMQTEAHLLTDFSNIRHFGNEYKRIKSRGVLIKMHRLWLSIYLHILPFTLSVFHLFEATCINGKLIHTYIHTNIQHNNVPVYSGAGEVQLEPASHSLFPL